MIPFCTVGVDLPGGRAVEIRDAPRKGEGEEGGSERRRERVCVCG